MKPDNFEVMWEHSIYYPFADRAEWELAKFLCDNFNQGQITRFLKLLWTRKPLSFKNAKQLFTFMDALPVIPRWKCTPIHTDGYTTTHPMNLIWRDALEVVHHIFSNPIFANHMEYNPYEINNNVSCEQASEIQDQLPVGATIVPIILASDKTPVTRQTGSLEMHPTFLTIGNIHSEICMKATSHAWACITYILVPEYVVNSEFSGLLEAHIWHKYMDLVLQNLKVAAGVGEFMVDPMGCQHYAFTPLAAHITDLPEQTMIIGVHQPYWCNWGCADPSIFLWCKEVIGPSELDARFCSQHKHVGTCHFHDGVSHVNQMTGCKHHDIQRTLVPTIAGVTSDGFTRAIHTLINFIYKAQAPTFTRSSIDSMVSSLNEFHTYKHFILEAEARMGTSGPIIHFQIPKLKSFNFHQQGTFTQQIVNIINHEDVMRQFDLYALLRISLINVMDDEFDEVVNMDPTFSWIACVAPQEMHRFQAIHPVRNHFLIAHDLADCSAAALTQHYCLADFPNVLSQYHDGVSGWNSLYHGRLLKACQQVQAYPPCDAYPFGKCDIILLQPTDAHPKSLPCVVQVPMLPVELKEPLLYVQQFEIAAPPEAEPHIAMYRVQRSFYPASDGSSSRTRIGKIVWLIDVTHAVELIPIYGTTMDHSVSSTTSLERYDNFYLNAFSMRGCAGCPRGYTGGQ
ncbi:hypothetical protein BDR03DRAFT_932486 [Suillus americanus]|nr:hypothetical protein BDR03DRAFT_932486 [Suillus americanus]